MHLKLSAAVVFGFLAACGSQQAAISVDPSLPTGDPRTERLVFNECAIYFAAVAKLRADGRTATADPTRGCPADAISRAVDINPMVSVPSVSPGFPQELYARMIARGVPTDLADDISRSKAFWDLVAQRDSAVGSI